MEVHGVLLMFDWYKKKYPYIRVGKGERASYWELIQQFGLCVRCVRGVYV